MNQTFFLVLNRGVGEVDDQICPIFFPTETNPKNRIQTTQKLSKKHPLSHCPEK